MAQTDQWVEKIIDGIVVAGHKGQIGEQHRSVLITSTAPHMSAMVT